MQERYLRIKRLLGFQSGEEHMKRSEEGNSQLHDLTAKYFNHEITHEEYQLGLRRRFDEFPESILDLTRAAQKLKLPLSELDKL